MYTEHYLTGIRNTCPLEELPDDESRTMEFKRSLEKYWSLKNNN